MPLPIDRYPHRQPVIFARCFCVLHVDADRAGGPIQDTQAEEPRAAKPKRWSDKERAPGD